MPMFLSEVAAARGGPYGEAIRQLELMRAPVPGIMRLFAFHPQRNAHLADFIHEVLRGPSALSAGTRELIAAYVSHRNQCVY